MVSCKKPLLLDVSKTVKHGETDRNREPLCAEFSLGVETLQGLTNLLSWSHVLYESEDRDAETPFQVEETSHGNTWTLVSHLRHLPFFVQCCFMLFRRSAFENQNLLWSDVTGQASALPENFPRKPEVIYADKDVLKHLETT